MKLYPPTLKTVLERLPAHHPRVQLDKDEWDSFIESSQGKPGRQAYLKHANKVFTTPMKSVNDTNSDLVKGPTNKVQQSAMLAHESRRIIDGEKASTGVLICAYLLTKDRRYADEAVKRAREMATRGDNENVMSDFGEATLLSLCSMAYDALYDVLDNATCKFLLNEIKKFGSSMYKHDTNRLENHITDDHVWQIIFRIPIMTAFTAYSELPKANAQTNYCYNLRLARFPGLNKDGGWYNGDPYFHVSLRTLVKAPYFHMRLTGYNYFSDPWYQGNAPYVIYQQPPSSKSDDNGSSHQNILTPNGIRTGYADALTHMTGSTYAVDHIRHISERQPDMLGQGSTSKIGSPAWFRLQCGKPSPNGPGLKDLPMGHVSPQSGLAPFSTDLGDTRRSAIPSFRSSPYGSTSHVIVDRNAFNTFWNGQSLFYSSGHHISFTDRHNVRYHRAIRAHDTILINDMGQCTGTEGYGWIPRHYVNDQIGYAVGDASSAYGKVISPPWLLCSKQNNLKYPPENGWDNIGLKISHHHAVALGKSGYSFIYDEPEVNKSITWNCLLYTVTDPMNIDKIEEYVHIQATSKDGVSDAYLFSAGTLKTDITGRFFVPAVSWLHADENGYFKPYSNHWHFTITSGKQKVYRFIIIVHTHAKGTNTNTVQATSQRQKDGSIQVDDWNIRADISTDGKSSFEVWDTRKGYDVSTSYKDYGSTVIHSGSKKTELKDEVPEPEI